jgi:TolA-binding protein
MKMKTTMKQRIISGIFFMMFIVVSAHAQKTSIHNSPEDTYRNGLELFHKQHYSAAYDRFMRVTDQVSDKESLLYSECLYHMGVCAYELLNNDAEYLLETFINDYPQNARTEMAGFYLANIQYREKRYKRALEKYELIDPEMLSQEQRLEYFFRYGYSAFMIDDFAKAKSNFIKVKDTEHLFSVYATYYFAHINYTEGNYATALESFKKLTDDENFGSIVPYYITQILFFQKKYTELIDFAEPFVENASTKRQPEISRLIGEAYFYQKNFAKAVFWFDKFRTGTSERLSIDDNYKIGYAYYATEDYAKAIPFLQNAVAGNDPMAQNAHYHLGSCYLKTGNKQQARNAFYQAYKIDENQIVAEDAMFHFAKLSYELAINPYNEAIKALLEYIHSYPNNHRVDEAYEYLINLYMQTKNYREALVSIEQIKRPNEKLNMAYQKIAYFRGVELFNDRNYREAVATFNKSINYPYDRNIRAQSIFWKGEAYYRLNLPDSALLSFNTFLQSPGAISSDLYTKALYNIGYIHFNKKQYDKALTNFRTFQEKHPVNNDAISYDAFIRTGDCFYALKRYDEAAVQYDKAVKPGVAYADYALFQRGNSKGVQANFQGKISDLELFLKTYTNSSYTPDVIYELASTYMIIENYTSAIDNFKKVVDTYKNSSYHVRSLLRLGMIYNNLDRNEQALTDLKKINQLYPSSDESKEALVLIRNIYTEMDRVDEFFSYVKSLGASVSATEQDSISYIAAENQYFKGDCPAAISSFEKYIQNFPDGAHILKAHFYKAECEYKAQKWDMALVGYEFVINRPWSKFSETSLLNSARIHYTKENYTKSALYYASLEEKAEMPENILNARQGMMRSYFKGKQYRQAIVASQKVIDTPKSNDESIVEARSIIGISAYNVEDFALTQQVFEEQKKLKSEYGAEAYYYMALINYTIGKYQESEKLIFELINSLPSYEYWIAKSFILLADNYVAMGSFYQAKHTLRSVIDNYEGVDLVMEAQQKMAEIEVLENNQPNE